MLVLVKNHVPKAPRKTLNLLLLLKTFAVYHISLNKCPGAYFLRDIQDPAFIQDRHLFEACCLILIAYIECTVHWSSSHTLLKEKVVCKSSLQVGMNLVNSTRRLRAFSTVVFEGFQETSDHSSDGLHLHLWERFLRIRSLVSSIWHSKRQSLYERQWDLTWQLISWWTTDWLLGANFVVTVCGTPTRDPGVYLNPSASHWAVKP